MSCIRSFKLPNISHFVAFIKLLKITVDLKSMRSSIKNNIFNSTVAGRPVSRQTGNSHLSVARFPTANRSCCCSEDAEDEEQEAAHEESWEKHLD